MNQQSRIKLYRTLKVVFYCLGLPLFFVAVLFLSNAFMGSAPFAGYVEEDMFAFLTVTLSSSGLYGVWIALGVWVFLAVLQITLHFTVKGRRTRMFAMVAASVIVMMVPVFVIDSVFTAKIDELAANAPTGVTTSTYRDELSYYRMFTSSSSTSNGRLKSSTEKLIDSVESVMRVYNVNYYSAHHDGTAGNMGNIPVTYYDLGIDYDNDGVLSRKEYDADGNLVSLHDEKLVKANPQGDKLVINGKTYNDCFFVEREFSGKAQYLWYRTSKMPEYGYGEYGWASYNQNGMLSDGYVFSVPVVLNILEDYYGAEANFEKYKEGTALADLDFATARATMFEYGNDAQQSFYIGNNDLYDEHTTYDQLFRREIGVDLDGSGIFTGGYKDDFSLTVPELNKLVGLLLGGIANGKLIGFIAGLLGETLIDQLNQGVAIPELVRGVLVAVNDLGITLDVDKITGDVTDALNGVGLGDLKVTVYYTAEQGDPDRALYIALESAIFEEQGGKWELILGEGFDIDSIDGILQPVVNLLIKQFGLSSVTGIVNTVLGLVGVDITLFDENGNFVFSVKDLLMSLLDGLYWYQSPVIIPYWDFYTQGIDKDENPNEYYARKALADYERALYEGSLHGSLIGSVLIGDTIGDGSYQASNGLADINAVRQLQYELSYKPEMYPILSVRDMLLIFAGIVALFTMLSYYAAEKEYEWSTGKGAELKEEELKKKAEKKASKKRGKKGAKPVEDEAVTSDTAANPEPLEDTAFNLAENNDGEVA